MDDKERNLENEMWQTLQGLIAERDSLERGERSRLVAIAITNLETALLFYRSAKENG